MADTEIKVVGLPTGLTLTVDVMDPSDASVLQSAIAMTESSGVYSGDVTGAHAGLLMFVIKASGTPFETHVRTIADDDGPWVIHTGIENVYVEPDGAYQVDFTVTDDAVSPLDLEGATIRLVGVGINRAKLTDSDGELSWALNAGTYAVTVTMPGHDDHTTSLVVSAADSVTYQLTPTSSGLAADPDMSVGTATVYDEYMAAEAGVPVSFKLISGPGTAGRILDQKPFTLISEDGTGGTVLGRIISDKFAQGHTYERWRGAAEGADASSGLAIRSSAQRTSFTVPYESTFLIAETIGVDAEE